MAQDDNVDAFLFNQQTLWNKKKIDCTAYDSFVNTGYLDLDR